jgi:hypothetical protein
MDGHMLSTHLRSSYEHRMPKNMLDEGRIAVWLILYVWGPRYHSMEPVLHKFPKYKVFMPAFYFKNLMELQLF